MTVKRRERLVLGASAIGTCVAVAGVLPRWQRQQSHRKLDHLSGNFSMQSRGSIWRQLENNIALT